MGETALSLSQEDLRDAMMRHIEAALNPEFLRTLGASLARAKVETLTFEEAADLLRLKAKNRHKAFAEYAANHRIRVVQDGKRSLVRVERLLEHMTQHEMLLSPRKAAQIPFPQAA